VADFVLRDQNGKKFSLQKLRGKVWVASFVFTRCAGPCPRISGSLARLQHDLGGENDVELVTFTVDPEHDTPKVLKEHAGHYGADARRWHWLTGKPSRVYRLIRSSFHLGVEPARGKDRTPGNEVTHSTRLALVDGRGHVRGYFDGTSEADVKTLAERARTLAQGQP
jgi:cytochrome oxidase Cu insertion factor (SCO1/SenC/PrrC family)